MSVRELVVLGTSSQVPTRHRNHNGYFLRWDGEGLMFDPGEGTQRQMILFGVTASSITRILISHFHGDHCLGFASLVQRISLDGVPHQVEVYYPASGQVFFDRLRHASIFHDVARIRPHPIAEAGVLAETEDLSLEARRLDHKVDCWGYRLQEPDRWNLDPKRLAAHGLSGVIVGELKRRGETEIDGRTVRLPDVGELRRGQSVAFVMDTRLCEAAFELARDVDLLICESTYLDSEAREAAENGHLTAREAATIAHDAGVGRLLLTHFSQRYTEIEPFLDEARAVHDDVVVARDGDTIPLPPRRGRA